ncbi:DUF4174 domain-containing protein [Cellvibrio sp. UBA7671]|uniref:DUF4174 domain-containing protein n=1 Tax=Cellvibrio sp. UBA7671 TaxID=1946312 RepID=UPI002F358AAD
MRSVFIFILSFFSMSVAVSQDNPFGVYQWQYRILVIYTADNSTDEFLGQVQEFTQNKDAFEERDLVVFQIHNDVLVAMTKQPEMATINALSVKTALGIAKDDKFQVVLIGKDGGIKLRESQMVSSQKLFTLIDGMPMRRSEKKTPN